MDRLVQKLITPSASATDEYLVLGELMSSVLQNRTLLQKEKDLRQLEYEVWYAKAYTDAFSHLESNLGRTPNISSAEYLVKLNPDYLTFKSELIELTSKLEDVNRVREILQLRKEYLMSKAADTRAGI